MFVTTMWVRCQAIALALALSSLGAVASGASLIDAVKSGDAAAVRRFISTRADVNAPEPDGTTALHWAADREDPIIAKLLIAGGANVDAANRHGVTPLALAAANGHTALIEILLVAGADPNAALPSGETALMSASRAGRADGVKALLSRGADPNRREQWKQQTALMWAAHEGNSEAVRALVAAGADIQARSLEGFTALLFSVRQGHVDTTRALLDARADVNEALPNAMSALLIAVISANYDVGTLLLERGADPDTASPGWTPLHQLVWARRNTLTFPLPVPSDTTDSLSFAARLLAAGADPNARLTKEPQDGYVNSLNRIGATAFLLAAKNDDVPLMRLLLANGADPFLGTVQGTTPLMAAAGVGLYTPGESPGTPDEATEAVRLCLGVGADPLASNANGETALHGTAYRGASGAARLLVDAGAKLDVVNKQGWTPWKIADGVQYNATFKRQPETAAVLRELMMARGVWIGDEAPTTAPKSSAAPK